jgi:hypothetical protein
MESEESWLEPSVDEELRDAVRLLSLVPQVRETIACSYLPAMSPLSIGPWKG